MAATDAPVGANSGAIAISRRAGRSRGSSGPDRLTVVLFSLATFLVVLALLAGQLPALTRPGRRPVLVLRKVYRTTVVETLAGGSAPTGTSVTQSVSSSGGGSTALTAPTTRTS